MVLRGTAATVEGSVTQEFECAAVSNAGKIGVPTSMLLAMPANTGQLALLTYALPDSFTALGMDAAFVVAEINSVVNVTYK